MFERNISIAGAGSGCSTLLSRVKARKPKLFVVKADVEDPNGNDQESLDVLEELYPNGQLRMFDSDVPGHDFWVFLVPG